GEAVDGFSTYLTDPQNNLLTSNDKEGKPFFPHRPEGRFTAFGLSALDAREPHEVGDGELFAAQFRVDSGGDECLFRGGARTVVPAQGGAKSLAALREGGVGEGPVLRAGPVVDRPRGVARRGLLPTGAGHTEDVDAHQARIDLRHRPENVRADGARPADVAMEGGLDAGDAVNLGARLRGQPLRN